MATHSSILALKIPRTEELGAGYYPWGRKESGTTERLHFLTFTILYILDEVIPLSENRDIVADLSADITDIIKEYSKVDWTSNIDIHKKISHALDDLLYDYSDNNNWDLSFEIMDKIIDNVKTIALRRF